MTEYLGKNFVKETAYTLRCGGKGSPIDDRIIGTDIGLMVKNID